MKILFASDSFKGSLTSGRIAELLEEVTREVFPDAATEGLLVADGGEGTMEAVVGQMHGSYRKAVVAGPLWEEVEAVYGLLPDARAVIEMAQASGLPLLPEEKRCPLQTTSFGTGMLIRDALERGIRDIVIAIGGSATNDGGMGAMSALGVRFLDESGALLRGCGEDLGRVRAVDVSRLHPAARETTFTVMCDVTNPLLGNEGATYTFGPQKGADAGMLKLLEQGMRHYADVTETATGKDCSLRSGAGAAGGLGFALMAFLNAELRPGAEAVLDLLHFDEKLRGTDLVITGEGRMDRQSVSGKLPSAVGRRCKRAGVCAVAVTGSLADGYQAIYREGICSAVTTVSGVMDLHEAVRRSGELYRDAAFRLLSAVKCGMEISAAGGRKSEGKG